MTPLLIRHPRILLPNGEFLLGDILIEGGKIVQVSSKITPLDWITVVDATGLTLLPALPTVWCKKYIPKIVGYGTDQNLLCFHQN